MGPLAPQTAQTVVHWGFVPYLQDQEDHLTEEPGVVVTSVPG